MITSSNIKIGHAPTGTKAVVKINASAKTSLTRASVLWIGLMPTW
jgi:hypothetical protein